MNSRWRRAAAPIIAACLKETTDPTERRRSLRRAYPFGSRRGWPYTCWLTEVQAQWPGFSRTNGLPLTADPELEP